MSIPKVVIVGRPNVGKSSLLNALAGSDISIVEPTPGVTRDRVSTIIEKNDMYFEIIDTGGYGIDDCDKLSEHIEYQIQQAIISADIVIFMVDIRDGLMPLDKEIAQILRKWFDSAHHLEPPRTIPSVVEGEKFRAPAATRSHRGEHAVIGVANKADEVKFFPAAAEFARLGFGEFLCISAKNNLNKSILLEKIIELMPATGSEKPAEPVMKIAIVGKRNSGKSSLVNAIVGDQRVIVSEVPGTTRDAVDVRFEKDGKTIIVIDTAGVRKKSSMESSIEFYSYVRATRSIRRSDIVLLIIESTVEISGVDKKLARLICDEYKSCIIVVNKWDLAKERATTEDYKDYLTKVLPELKASPIAFTTATQSKGTPKCDGLRLGKPKNIQSLLDLSIEIFKQATTWISTPKLNKALEFIRADDIVTTRRGSSARPKIYYATQIAVNPITILLFVNNPALFEENYRKFIMGKLQSLLPIAEVPIRLLIRSHRQPKA
jgi:GTP-binding protein